MGPYWPPERRWVDEGYRTLPFPFNEVAPPPIELTAEWTLREFLGYLDTWSSVGQYTKATNRDPFPELVQQLESEWGGASRTRTICWPLGMRVGYRRRADGGAASEGR